MPALVAGIWFGVSMGQTAATATPLVTSVLERDSLHVLGMRALVLDISHSDFIGDINRGPLTVTEDDVARVLHATYGEVDTSAKAREVHAGLVRFVRSYPEGRTFSVSIEAERPTLVDSIGRIVKGQYAALPQCGLGDDLSALLSAASIKLFGGSGEEFFHERHPDCRPPEVIASRVEEGIDLELGTMSAAGPDSVDAFPEDPSDAAFAMLMARIDRALYWTHPVWPLFLLLVAAGVAVWGHPGWAGAAARPLVMFGVGMVLYGIAAVAILPDAIQGAFEGAGTPGEASEVWASLGRYAFQRVGRVSGLFCGILGIAILAAGLAIGRTSNRSKTTKEALS